MDHGHRKQSGGGYSSVGQREGDTWTNSNRRSVILKVHPKEGLEINRPSFFFFLVVCL